MNTVKQGATFAFNTGLTGDLESAFSVTMDVLQYPGDTPTISRSLDYSDAEEDFTGALTSAETALLTVGQWWIHIKATDSDEDIRGPIKIYVEKGWV